MSEAELIKRLKAHLEHCKRKYGKITTNAKKYCIQYIMDFQMSLTKEQAEELYNEKILSN